MDPLIYLESLIAVMKMGSLPIQLSELQLLKALMMAEKKTK